MARIRSIKPEFWDSPGTARATMRARLFFIAMWNWADDWGIGDANAKRLVGFAFPNDNDISAADYPTLRGEMSDCFDVLFYSVEGRDYYSIPSWEDHQRTEKKARRANPGPDEADGPVIPRESESSTDGGGLSDAEPRIPARGNRGTGEEGTGEQGKGNRGTGEQSSSSEVAIAPIRHDVLSLIALLDSEIVANGGKPPARTKKNLDAARLMLDRDGRTAEQVESAIRWSQADEFWRGNILSMSKLREKYEQLRLAAARNPAKRRNLTAVEQNLVNYQQKYGASNG